MATQEKNILSELAPEGWVADLLSRAIKSRASDIHFEPTRDSFYVRFRIDGLLYLMENLNKKLQESIVSQIKVISGLNIAEHRLPQDGHLEFNYSNRLYNIRVSTFPTIYGEAAVLRILNRADVLLDLKDLGYDTGQLETMRRLINQPSGILLITGPSASGKTTRLYSILNTLNKPTNNIITIEDPVEFHLDGTRQTQVKEEIGFTYAKALRSILRQDPDIIMVGEIRDNETAQMCMQAALTGRLVLSTFHTFDVFAVIARLIEMGIPKSVIANTIIGVISSRLVRTICPKCKIQYQPSDVEKKILGDIPPGQKFYKGKGCGQCLKSGYFGRIGVSEVVEFDDDIRYVIIEKPLLSEILEVLRQKKIKNLWESALNKVLQGITTIEEAIRVTGKQV